jgi:LacI family transcriptional regulator
MRPKSARPTITDVAGRAFVSKATVSHVLNGTRFVEEPTRQRVLQAIAELGYRPSVVARGLTTRRTGTIGMIISDAANQFFGEMLRGVEDVLRSASYALIVCNTDEVLEREEHYLDLLMGQRVEGIIAAATSRKWAVLAQAQATHTPIVFVDRRFEGLEGPYVGADNIEGARQGTRHLIESGCSEIGIVAGFQRLSSMRERLVGFQQALAEANLPLPDEWVATCELGIETGREAVRHVLTLPHHPRALFINNNFLMLGALLAVKDLGLGCPEDIALMGFDDHPWAAVCAPPLSVVRQPAHEIGRVAADLLCALIDGKQVEKSRIELGCELVLRQSCCRSHAESRESAPPVARSKEVPSRQ